MTTSLSDEQATALCKLRQMLDAHVQGLLKGQLVLFNKDMTCTQKAIKHASVSRLRRAAVQLRCALIIYHELSCNRRLQKRDLFYRDVRLFRRQHVSDRAIAALASTFQLPREALNVVGATRGVMYGGWLRLSTTTGGTMDIIANGHRHIIPHSQDIASLDGNLDFVVIVEKEAVFELVAASWQRLYEAVGRSPFLVVTAKGYPDRATSLFLGVLRRQRPCMRFLILVDWDPFGMDIYRKYKDGLRDTYCPIPDLELLGLKDDDIKSMTIPLTMYDKRKMYQLIRELSQDDELVRRQLLAMNDMNGKMEIDVLADKPHNASLTDDYLVPALQSLLLHDTV